MNYIEFQKKNNMDVMTMTRQNKINSHMTNEEKELLLKDLCQRILYGVNFMFNEKVYVIKGVDLIVTDKGNWEYAVIAKGIAPIEINFIKPYLRPITTITEEEAKDFIIASDKDMEILQNSLDLEPIKIVEERVIRAGFTYNEIDWMNKHHFDYRGLIEKGLAIKAPKEMYE